MADTATSNTPIRIALLVVDRFIEDRERDEDDLPYVGFTDPASSGTLPGPAAGPAVVRIGPSGESGRLEAGSRAIVPPGRRE
jgi:hypothetical protein